jgi:hypothetical protein
MAKFILTSRFIKNPAFANAGKLLQYMATRDGVEKLPRGIDNKPATKQQEKLINSITKKFPETKQSIEFEDYENACPLLRRASWRGKARQSRIVFSNRRQNQPR